MAGSDPGSQDLIPSMRSVQLNDEDRQLMSAFKEKVDAETDTYLHSESDPRYRGGHIPSKTFRILQAATGAADSVSGGPAPSSRRIGGPGQARTVLVNMPSGGAGGQQVHPSQQEVPQPKKYTGGNIPSRSFQMLQQMTANEQGSKMAPPAVHQPDELPRRSPSHYANIGNSEAGTVSKQATINLNVTPTCERIERESRNTAAASAHNRATRDERRAEVLDELQSVNRGHSPRANRPSTIASRSFRLLQEEYGSEEVTPPPPNRGQVNRRCVDGGETTSGIETGRVSPNPDRISVGEKMAASSKTYRMLQTDPASVSSVFGKNKR